eukprot:9383199-Pyramimonas_sp.AAC.1
MAKLSALLLGGRNVHVLFRLRICGCPAHFEIGKKALVGRIPSRGGAPGRPRALPALRCAPERSQARRPRKTIPLH